MLRFSSSIKIERVFVKSLGGIVNEKEVVGILYNFNFSDSS
jgi:hypothetical protein